ncbi:PP2C family protein-serine/threonine phosphatase [Streptomyces sp. NPDC048603]|uniref:PP2C family protein-serine/threonine phosphatase n=1 Tax=Streptomyces sp. NPDC048603 TaxID=3365577 RepID=UPI003724AAD6
MTMRGEMPRVRRVCVLAWGGAAVSWELSSPGALVPSLATCAAFLMLAGGSVLHMRQRLLAELRRARQNAGAARQALLRPLPPRVGGLALAAVHGAEAGGDLYDALPTPYGVRVVMGDVRGHGIPALGAATAVLGAFREAAHEEPSLAGVLRRMELALACHLRDRAALEHLMGGTGPDSPPAEEFVTVLLLEIGRDGTLTALNCGHPWPYRLPPVSAVHSLAPTPWEDTAEPGDARPARDPGPPELPAEPERLDCGETLPPLGVWPLPDELAARDCGELRRGEGLFLHTDGAAEARDPDGRYFPLGGAIAEAAAATPARLVEGVHDALLRHTGGHLDDDVALLVLRR